MIPFSRSCIIGRTLSTNTIIKPSHSELRSASDLLKSLIRIDTSNPPGNELEAVDLLAWHCSSEGFTPEIVGPDPNRPNLIAKLDAEDRNRSQRPLVLSCHLDTVPANPEHWTHPPFSAHEEDGYIWGRGTIDMKGFAAMAFTAINLLKRSHLKLNRDVIFAAVSDEEAGTDLGSKWLVRERPDLLGTDPEYVINEVGGFTVYQRGRRYYPVQVAEKGIAWLRLTATGTPGHSSLPASDSAVATLADAVTSIARARLPWHPGQESRAFLEGMAAPQGAIAQKAAHLLSHPFLGPRLLPLAIPDSGHRAAIEAILRNTANPTRFASAQSINVLPGKISVDIDGRLAPGQTAQDLVRELKNTLNRSTREKVEFEIVRESTATSFPTDTPLYRAIEDVIAHRDAEGIVVPGMISGFTDSHNYAKLGATCYGFYPLQLPEGLEFAKLFHGNDERIPVKGFHWGIITLMQLLSRFLTSDEE